MSSEANAARDHAGAPVARTGINDGRGHGIVKPRPDGARARCMGPGRCKVCSAELDAAAAEWDNAAAAAQAERDGLYTERAHLVALATTVYPSWLEIDPAEPDWPVVHILGPYGLMGWHLAARDVHLFDHVPRGGGPAYDGHTKLEALERLELCTVARGAPCRSDS